MRWNCRATVLTGQTAYRRCVTRQIALLPHSPLEPPAVVFEGAGGFRLENCSLIPGRPPWLRVTVAYRLRYADGPARLCQSDRAVFDLPLPTPAWEPGRVRRFESGGSGRPGGARIRVEGLACAFAPLLCPQTGALILTIGAFFVVRREEPHTLGLAGEPLAPKGGTVDETG